MKLFILLFVFPSTAFASTGDEYSRLLYWLAGAAIVGLVGWVGRVQKQVYDVARELQEYKLHVAETYMRKGPLDELREEVHALRLIVYEIAVKLDIPIRGNR